MKAETPREDSEPATQLRVLHVTEAFAGGVLSSLTLLAAEQARSGDSVMILHTRRPETPGHDEIERQAGAEIKRVDTGYSVDGWRNALRFGRCIRKTIAEENPDVIHLHSSHAGWVGRLCLLSSPYRRKILYSPHGFAFTRTDMPIIARLAATVIEFILARCCAGLILVSSSESTLARKILLTKRTAVLENRLRMSGYSPAYRGAAADVLPVVVGTAARISYAKAPWIFGAVADKCGRDASFVWLGDGPKPDREKWLEPSNVMVTGWLSHTDLVKQLWGLDIYLSTSLWEGLPVSVIEAQALGIPCVVTNCMGNRDVVLHGVTGYVATDPEQLRQYVNRLVNDAELRRRLGRSARQYAVKRFAEHSLARDCANIYAEAIGRYAPS